ncbi:MAG: iron-containing alcohol dehydrogenase [Bacteriovoracaceae bacterium]|nr:iron-containing alcohol dehydrogenase [Bacteriovoracaceae bacterium]
MKDMIQNPLGLLDSRFECECGKEHAIATKKIVFSKNANVELVNFLKELSVGNNILMLCDKRTYEAAGASTEQELVKSGFSVKKIIIPDEKGKTPACDDITFDKLMAQIENPEFMLAVGSGVVSDLTKWLSFEKKCLYATVATAATMNGYTAANVAPALKGVKCLLNAHSPMGVFANPDVVSNAPFELTASGLGDAVAKAVSAADWKMNNLIFNEHFCPLCAELIASIEPIYFDNPKDVASQSVKGVKAVFDALIYSGMAMTMIGNSAPASGGEHLFSHTLDMMSKVDGLPHDLHGRQVGLGTVIAASLYEKLFSMENVTFTEMPKKIDEGFWKNMSGAVSEQYNIKMEKIPTVLEYLNVPGNWEKLKASVQQHLRPADKIATCLSDANAAIHASDIGCDKERVRNTLVHMHEIRKRFTIVDLAWMAGILPNATDELIERWLV